MFSNRNITKQINGLIIRRKRETKNPIKPCIEKLEDDATSPDLDRIFNYQLTFCMDIPLCTMEHENTCERQSCCESCSCNPECRKYKTCCPDAPASILEPYDENIVCVNSAMFHSNEVPSYWMRKSCSKHNFNKTLETLCKSDKLSIIQRLPVTSDVGNTTYRNMYCALCNQDTSYNKWSGQINCTDGNPLLSRTLDEIERELVQRNDYCNLVFKPPKNSHLIKCDNRNINSTCNVTGLWQNKDKFIEKACRSYTSVYTSENKIHFQNIFCHICNTAKIPDTLQSYSGICNELFSKPKKDHEDDSSKLDTTECSRNHMYDQYSKLCRPVGCLSPLQYINSTCNSVFESMMGMEFELYLKVKVDNVSENCYGCGSSAMKYLIAQTVALIYQQVLKDIRLSVVSGAVYYKSRRRPSESHETLSFIITEFLYIFRLLKVEESSYLETVSNLLNTDSQSLVYNDEFANKTVQLAVDGKSYIKTMIGKNYILHDIINEETYFHSGIHWSVIPESRPPIRISYLLLCPHVNITKKEWHWEYNGEELCFKGIDICLKSSQYTAEDQQFMICRDQYERMVSLYIQRSADQTQYSGIENVLSIVCMAISATGLTITFVTYCLFKILRTLPGLNIMALSLSMLLAFTLMFIGPKIKHQVLCSIFGLLIHFFWLYTFGWMNVCCMHIFKTFCSLKVATNEVCRPFALYALYTLLFSSIFVGINIVREVTSGAEDFGYSTISCYISKNENKIITFGLPLAMVIVINIVLFVVVIVRIQRIPTVQKDVKHSRNNLLIFVKLSTFTGATWVFGFLYSFSGLRIFSYLFIVFGGLQGLFVMFAFVINKRVLILYKARFFKTQMDRQRSGSYQKSSDTAETRY